MKPKIIEKSIPVYVSDSGLGTIIWPKPSPATLWRWRKAGLFPEGIKLPGGHRLNRSREVIDCIESYAKERLPVSSFAPRVQSATVFTMPLSSAKTLDSSVGMSA